MPSTQQQPREGTGEAQQAAPAPDFTLGNRDVRRKRPPAMSFLLKLDTLRKVVRIGTLGTLDFFGIYMALLTALAAQGGPAERRLEPAPPWATRCSPSSSSRSS